MHVRGRVGEEDVAAAADLHQRHALPGELLLEEVADPAGAEGLEVHLPLERDHRALTGEAVAVELDLEHLPVLEPQTGLRGLLLLVLRGEQVAAHRGSS